MDPFNALSTAVIARMIPPLREAHPTKVTSCTLVTSTDLEKALDVVKEVIGGAGAPSAMMGGRLAKSPSWLATVGGQLTPPPQGGSAITSASEFPYCLGQWFASCSCAFPLSDDRERAPFNHAHASFYGCPHPEEDNHLEPAGGSIK
jgi:hypothetical protein